MTGDGGTARLRLVPADGSDPAGRLLADLPPAWHGEVIGPGIDGWETIVEGGRDRPIRLPGLPARLRHEIAWMAHWQHRDGLKVSVDVCNQLASMLAWADESGRPLPSLAWAGKHDLLRLHGVWFHARHGRLPAEYDGRRVRLERLLSYPQLALAARLHDGAWWEMDTWHPRCDPRIPLRDREPCRSVGCSPGEARLPWVKNAVKWHLGVLLEPAAVSAGKVNLDLWSVAGLMDFLAGHRQEAAEILGPSPWDGLTDAHPAIWLRQRLRLRRCEPLDDETRYVDDHAFAQVTACLPVLGEPASGTVTVTSGGSTRVLPGQGDPQLMRMLLLQILTGRRASEICLCPFDCLSPATDSAIEAAEGDAVARFRYGQSKIDAAPDTIFVDAETVAVIEEQQQWLRDRFPGRDLPYLFPQRRANAHAAKPYGNTNYGRSLALFSELAQITDAAGHPVKLSHTHRFRHTKFTKLAELGLPVHVLQRYAGHSTPTMSMHYVARRDEHAEQAFLATRKFRADGTRVSFSREDHDALHLLDRADRFLPNGYCLLPPLQKCEKGNACLTCSVFVTDDTHLAVLQRQLGQTAELIERTTAQFLERHGHPMPDGNVWLVEREAERDALARLLATMQASPGRAIQGAGSPSSPVPVSIDLDRHRKPQP